MLIKYIFTLLFILPLISDAATNDSEWINKMKTLSAHTLDSSLPVTPYEHWFSSFAGGKSKLNWEVNDCGEQDGSGQQRDFPICVQVSADLSINKQIAISTLLGTHKRGFVGTPKIWMIYIKDNEKYRIFKSIEEATEYLSNK